MTSSKDAHSTRPPSQHRTSIFSTPSLNVPNRHMASRNHSHSVSLGTLNPTHRVTRRKSITSSTANNMTAMAAAVQSMGGVSFTGLPASDRLGFPAKNGRGLRAPDSMGMSRPFSADQDSYSTMKFHSIVDDVEHEDHHPVEDTAIADGLLPVGHNGGSSKGRSRRASEGAYLTKVDGKRANGELRCEKCGKGYKHSSCLTKHLWEHTPEWSLTSKLLISKHQQVQLLEAASVLVTMNQESSTSPEMAKASDSDASSDSPAASAASEAQDDDTSSVESSPPPMSEDAYLSGNNDVRESKRDSSNSSIFSRSYQSAPSGSVAASSMTTTASYGSYRYGGYQRRPSTSGSGTNDEAGLAAAVELCHFYTPRSGPVHLPLDVPPVPPLPERYQSHNANRSAGNIGYPAFQQDLGLLPPLTHRISDERDVKMYDSSSKHIHDDDDDYYDNRSVSRGHSDEDDDGVFGRMEE